MYCRQGCKRKSNADFLDKRARALDKLEKRDVYEFPSNYFFTSTTIWAFLAALFPEAAIKVTALRMAMKFKFL